jgi:hypothetical protein
MGVRESSPMLTPRRPILNRESMSQRDQDPAIPPLAQSELGDIIENDFRVRSLAQFYRRRVLRQWPDAVPLTSDRIAHLLQDRRVDRRRLAAAVVLGALYWTERGAGVLIPQE